jgi:hypothetical protein
MVGFHALHDSRRYTVPRYLGPYTQTRMHGVRRLYLSYSIYLILLPGS